MSSLDSATAGLANYVVKKDFRRQDEREIRAEGYDYFWPNTSAPYDSDPGNQPFPVQAIGAKLTPPDTEQINLVHMAVRPNGEVALIVGTPTTLYRYNGFSEPVFAVGGDDCSADSDCKVFVDDYNLTGPVYDVNPADWKMIGTGFSADGQRWEACNINGYACFNNGVDLPVTYRVEEDRVVPIYQLREAGYSNFGAIADYTDTLFLGDVSELDYQAYEELFTPRPDETSGQVNADQEDKKISASSDFFEAKHVGRTVVWDTGEESDISSFTNARLVESPVDKTVPRGTFRIRVKASQAGGRFYCKTDCVVAGDSLRVSVSGFFDPGVKMVMFSNGFSTNVTRVDDTHVTLAELPPSSDLSGSTFWSMTDTAYVVTASSDIWTAGVDEGKYIVFDDGSYRNILEVLGPTTVKVDVPFKVDLQFFSMLDSAPGEFVPVRPYDRVTGGVSRIQYRVTWSGLNDPRKYPVTYRGSMNAGGFTLVLRHPVASIRAKQVLYVSGAGENEGNLIGEVLSVTGGRVVTLNVRASNSVNDAPVTEASSFGTISKYDDPPGDYSGIVAMLKISNQLAIYKDKSVVLASYTGNIDAPFVWRHLEMPDGGLHYRNTLIGVSTNQHVYAGEQSFWSFDTTSLRPRIFELSEACRSAFFDTASLTDKNLIFSARNVPTREIWFVVPNVDPLCFDYRHNTFRTTGTRIIAGDSVKSLVDSRGVPYPKLIGEGESWFVIAVNNVLCVYGNIPSHRDQWSGKRIYYRRSLYPFDPGKRGYESVLESGEENFGVPESEKNLVGVTLNLSSKTGPAPDSSCKLAVLGTRNVAEGSPVLDEIPLPDPATGNFVPTMFMEHNFGYRVTVPALDNGNEYLAETPLEISSLVMQVIGIDSRSWTRKYS